MWPTEPDQERPVACNMFWVWVWCSRYNQRTPDCPVWHTMSYYKIIRPLSRNVSSYSHPLQTEQSSEHVETPAYTTAKILSSRQSHWNIYRPIEALMYYSCIKHANFVVKGSVQHKNGFQIHMINEAVAKQMAPYIQADDASMAPYEKHVLSPAKSGSCYFAAGSGGYCHTPLQNYALTWQRGLWFILIKALICLWIAAYCLLWAEFVVNML